MGRLALVAAIAAALPLILAASARGDISDAVADTAGAVATLPVPAEESPALGEAASAIPADAVSAAPEGAGQGGTNGAAPDSGSAEVPSPLPSSSPAPELPRESREDAVSVSVELESPLHADPDTAAPSTGQPSEPLHRVTELTRNAPRDAAETAERAVDRVTPGGHVQLLPPHPLQLASEILRQGALDSLLPGLVEDLLPPGGAQAAAFSQQAESKPPTASPNNALPGGRAMIPGRSLARPLTAFGGIAPLQLTVPSAAGGLVAGAPHRALAGAASAGSSGVSLREAGKRSKNLAPPDGDGPGPFPGSPQTNASGLSNSPFAPIVALLALLALAAPAIFRRLGEVPDLRGPTRFVCALERPG